MNEDIKLKRLRKTTKMSTACNEGLGSPRPSFTLLLFHSKSTTQSDLLLRNKSFNLVKMHCIKWHKRKGGSVSRGSTSSCHLLTLALMCLCSSWMANQKCNNNILVECHPHSSSSSVQSDKPPRQDFQIWSPSDSMPSNVPSSAISSVAKVDTSSNSNRSTIGLSQPNLADYGDDPSRSLDNGEEDPDESMPTYIDTSPSTSSSKPSSSNQSSSNDPSSASKYFNISADSNLLTSFFSHIDKQWKFAEIILIIVISTILNLITIIGNIMVLISFKMDRSLQTVSNYFLLSLALADLLIGLISMPLYTLYLLLNYWPLGVLMCDIWLAIDYLNSNAAVLNMLIISFDRYFSVTRPLTYRAKRTTKHACLMISCAWILSLTIWTPAIFTYPYYKGRTVQGTDKCEIEFVKANTYLTFVTAILAFYIPVIIMIYLYWRIWLETKKRYRDLTTLFLVSGVGAAAPARVTRPQLQQLTLNSNKTSASNLKRSPITASQRYLANEAAATKQTAQPATTKQRGPKMSSASSKPPPPSAGDNLAQTPDASAPRADTLAKQTGKISTKTCAACPDCKKGVERAHPATKLGPSMDGCQKCHQMVIGQCNPQKSGNANCRYCCDERPISTKLSSHQHRAQLKQCNLEAMANIPMAAAVATNSSQEDDIAVSSPKRAMRPGRGCSHHQTHRSRHARHNNCGHHPHGHGHPSHHNHSHSHHSHGGHHRHHHHHPHPHHHRGTSSQQHHHGQPQPADLLEQSNSQCCLVSSSTANNQEKQSFFSSSYQNTSKSLSCASLTQKVHPELKDAGSSVADDAATQTTTSAQPETPTKPVKTTQDTATSPIQFPTYSSATAQTSRQIDRFVSTDDDDDEDEDDQQDVETRIVSAGDKFKFESDNVDISKMISMVLKGGSQCELISYEPTKQLHRKGANQCSGNKWCLPCNDYKYHPCSQRPCAPKCCAKIDLPADCRICRAYANAKRCPDCSPNCKRSPRSSWQDNKPSQDNLVESCATNDRLPILKALEQKPELADSKLESVSRLWQHSSVEEQVSGQKGGQVDIKPKKTKKFGQKLTFSDILVDDEARVRNSKSGANCQLMDDQFSDTTYSTEPGQHNKSSLSWVKTMFGSRDVQRRKCESAQTSRGWLDGVWSCCKSEPAQANDSTAARRLSFQKNSSSDDSEAGQMAHNGSQSKSSYSSHHPIQPKSERKAAKTLSTLLLVFIVTWLPYNVLVLIKTLSGGEDHVPEKIWNFSYYLCYINSTINPLCYALCNAQFRRTYMRILKCKLSNDHNSTRRLVPLQSSANWNKEIRQTTSSDLNSNPTTTASSHSSNQNNNGGR